MLQEMRLKGRCGDFIVMLAVAPQTYGMRKRVGVFWEFFGRQTTRLLPTYPLTTNEIDKNCAKIKNCGFGRNCAVHYPVSGTEHPSISILGRTPEWPYGKNNKRACRHGRQVAYKESIGLNYTRSPQLFCLTHHNHDQGKYG